MSSSPSDSPSPIPGDLRLTTLVNMMPPGFQDSMVSHVLSLSSQLSEDLRSALAAAINSEVRVHGFPNFPERALPGLLKPAILSDLGKSDILASAVLNAWVALHSSLRAVVTKHLRNSGVDTEQPDLCRQRLNDFWSDDDWRSERDMILGSCDKLDKDDVALMLCCVTGRIPSAVKESSGGSDRTMEQTTLDQSLSYLEQLPADSPVWEAVPVFLASVAVLAKAKEAEREATVSREALLTTISEFLDSHSERLAYLELDTSGWNVPSDCDAAIVSAALDILEQLSGFIDEYDSVPDQGATHAETMRLHSNRDELVQRIIGFKSNLEGVLAPESGPDDTPSQPTTVDDGSPDASSGAKWGENSQATMVQPEAPEMGTDATLFGLGLIDLTLEFNPALLDYVVSLEHSIDVVTISPVANHSQATIKVLVEDQDGDAVRQLHPDVGVFVLRDIPVGQSRIMVNVVAEDRETTKTYTLAVKRPPSSDTSLSSLGLSVGEVEFDPGLAEYAIELSNGIDELSLDFEASHDGATVEVTLERPDGVTIDAIETDDGGCVIPSLSDGCSILCLTVTAEDRVTTRTYRVELNCRAFHRTEHVELVWSLVARDDLAGAYWLSKSLVADGQPPSLLPLLLKAVQGARWLSPDSKDFVEDLSKIVLQVSPPFDDDALAILGLAASLEPSIIAPETNLLAWLISPGCLPSLEGLVSSVRDFASRGHALRPEHIRGDEGQRQLDDRITKVRSDAGRWLEDADKRRHNLVRATNVLRRLCSHGGLLNILLSPVVDDRRGEAAKVRNDIEALKRDSRRAEAIAEADRLVLGSNPRSDITGAAKAWLQRAIVEACELATGWCDLVEREIETRKQAQSRWLSDQVTELRSQIESSSPAALKELSEVASDASRSDLSASSKCLARSMLRTLRYLGIDEDLDIEPPIPTVVRDLEVFVIVSTGCQVLPDSEPMDRLEMGLSKRLLWVPAVELGDDGRPLNRETPVELSKADEDWFFGDTQIDAAVKARADSSDFRFLDLLATARATDNSHEIAVLPSYSAELAAARETLSEHLAVVRDDVDQAANDGVIEYEGAKWNEFTHDLDDIIVDRMLNFRKIHDRLDAVQKSVGEERTSRREELVGDWEDLTREPLEEDTDREAMFLEALSITFQMAGRDKSLDIRVMEDCVSRMRNFRSGDRDDLELASLEGSRTTLEEFLRFSAVASDRQANSGGGLRNLVRLSRGEV